MKGEEICVRVIFSVFTEGGRGMKRLLMVFVSLAGLLWAAIGFGGTTTISLSGRIGNYYYYPSGYAFPTSSSSTVDKLIQDGAKFRSTLKIDSSLSPTPPVSSQWWEYPDSIYLGGSAAIKTFTWAKDYFPGNPQFFGPLFTFIENYLPGTPTMLLMRLPVSGSRIEGMNSAKLEIEMLASEMTVAEAVAILKKGIPDPQYFFSRFEVKRWRLHFFEDPNGLLGFEEKVIDIFGTVDSITSEITTCTAPQGRYKWDAITEFSGILGCGKWTPKGTRTANWGMFGKRTVLESDAGEQLRVACDPVPNHPGAYVLYYKQPNGKEWKVGLCPFNGGCNSAAYQHSGDNNGNNKPDCFMATEWESYDNSYNDKEPNPWTGQSDTPFEQIGPPAYEHLYDIARTDFDVNALAITKTSLKYQYSPDQMTFGIPFVIGCEDTGASGALFKTQPVNNTPIDPPLGPETEAFFDNVLDLIPRADPNGIQEPMGEVLLPRCDFTGDGLCDEDDRQFFEQYVGKCTGELGFNPLVDFDRDGCLTDADVAVLFEQDTDEDGVPDFGDRCITSNMDSVVIIDGCKSGVRNIVDSDGCTIMDDVHRCAEDAKHHGAFVSCVAILTNEFNKKGVISGKEKSAIQRCSAKADIP